jgi:hypothetical protein
MTLPVWPAGLPQRPQRVGYNESLAWPVIETAMDVGPPNQRPRQSSGWRLVNAVYRMTAAEYQTFVAWYDTTLGLSFTLPDPAYGGSTVTAQLTAAPQCTREGPAWSVSLSLRVFA